MAKARHFLAINRARTVQGARRNYRKAISDHLASALLVYTGLHIFVTMKAIAGVSESLLPFLGLVVLVAAVIPFARRVEARWEGLTAERAGDPALASLFARDRLGIWIAAIGLPFLLTGLFKLVLAFFH